ncbi:hypothetical protein G3578_09095 [Brevibacillus sp. SYP-B805]|uniref:hypothetical protein n=1 Tax=Brevibacillus sp. SYP-B805 TaxID=1578199 RepID=UPI0013EC67D3|nr:hypothetical protein [Brevibacillus sp. SYP-B805]NGQ95309.1 hypothetical protein [Brevibacillus sp. SYP-B805]
MTKEDLLRKLGSRKFWSLIAGVVTSISVIIGAGSDMTSKIAGLVGAIGSVVVYMIAEAYVDGKSAEAPLLIIEGDEDEKSL